MMRAMTRKSKSDATRLRQARIWRKLLRLTRGRVPLLRALQIICEEESDASFQAVLQDLRRSVEGGATFAEAVGRHASVFSLSIRELVRTAEKTGAWEEVLEEMAAGLEEGTFD